MTSRDLSALLREPVARLQTTLAERFPPGRVCQADTDLVVEGFPRSGNSYVVSMLNHLWSGDSPLAIAHHTHRIEAVVLGARLSKPVVVMLREPSDAILSLALFSGRKPRALAHRYLQYHADLLGLPHRPVLIDFDAMIGNFDVAIQAINQAGFRFPASPVAPDDVAAVRLRATNHGKRAFGPDAMLKVGAPSEDREVLKSELRAEVKAVLQDMPAVHRVYRRLLRERAAHSGSESCS